MNVVVNEPYRKLIEGDEPYRQLEMVMEAVIREDFRRAFAAGITLMGEDYRLGPRNGRRAVLFAPYAEMKA
jgi:hypothetical protein